MRKMVLIIYREIEIDGNLAGKLYKSKEKWVK